MPRQLLKRDRVPSARYVPNAAQILKTFRDRNHLHDKAAAKQLGLSEASFKGYLAGRPFTKRAQELALPRMGVATLAEASLQYDRETERTEIFDSLFEQSEGAFLAMFDDAREIKETRIMLSAFPPIDKLEYRPRLNKVMYDRLSAREICIRRIEQLNQLDRTIDLIHNIRTFNLKNYEVRILPGAPTVFPFLQFTIVDAAAVISGGFHADQGPPHHDPFIIHVGKRFPAFYEKVWARLDSYTRQFSILPDTEMLGLAVSELRKQLNDPRCKDLTPDQLDVYVRARGETIERFPTRY